MTKPDSTKDQRDRFLAFSFASADLFLEIAKDNTVCYATGAAKAITGVDDQEMIGKKWSDLFAKKYRRKIIPFIKKSRPGERAGPLCVEMDEDIGAGKEAILTGIRMPDSDNFYMTIGFVSDLMKIVSEGNDEHESDESEEVEAQEEEEHLPDKDHFMSRSKDAIQMAKEAGDDVDMTLIDMGELDQIKERMGEGWDGFVDDVGDLLSMNSYDGEAAGEIADGRYSVIHDAAIKSEDITQQLSELAKEIDPIGEGIDVLSKTISADVQNLSDREATKALVYTLNEFERQGTSVSIENLNTGFKDFVSANAHRIQEFKSIVETMDFDLHFQPIVNLESQELSHYEMLTRFRNGGSTQEMIIFGEDIGMAADFDIAVCDKAINYIMYKSAGNRIKYAVNLSGQSIQNEQFFKTLLAKLSLSKELPDRVIFEITESTTIEDLDLVNNYIQVLRKKGFKVCLDDFGAGSASFQYLHKLDVNYVKVDGEYTEKILINDKDMILFKNLTQMCKELGMGVIAEKIETKKEADALKEIGVEFGQGFLYSKPLDGPSYVPPGAF